MKDDQFKFIQTCLDSHVMRFGEFTLKSGRVSPYFFNAGRFNTGQALALLGRYYAQTLCQAGLSFDMLFGPAYKGIPLVSTTAVALAEHYQQDVPYAFNRKQVKDHGEGGQIVGADLRGRVVIVDDVVTVGTAIKASMELLEAAGATLAGVVVLLDRQEQGTESGVSAIAAIARRYRVPVLPVITLADIIAFVRQDARWQAHLSSIEAYQQRWGC